MLQINPIKKRINLLLLGMLGVVSSSPFANESQKNQQAAIVIIGASYAKALPINQLDGKQVINQGINGNQTHQMLERYKEDVIDLKPTSVIIWGFINDFNSNDISEADTTAIKIKDRFIEMVKLTKEANITPILATEVTMRQQEGSLIYSARSFIAKLRGKTPYHKVINASVQKTNDWLRNYAKQQGIQILEFGPALADDSGDRAKQYAQEDGSHITAAGYEVLRKIAVDEVKVN